MTQVAMTFPEFQSVEQQLQQLSPTEGIRLAKVDGIRGNICGNHPMSWAADYFYNRNGELEIHGHGLFGGKVESGIREKLVAALNVMRSTPKENK